MKTNRTHRLVAAALALIMVLAMIPVSPLSASAETVTRSFEAATDPALDGITADKTSVADGTKFGTDGFLTLQGTQALARTSSGAVVSVELAKREGDKLVFEVSGTATVTIVGSSTGGSSQSSLVIRNASGTAMPNTNGEDVTIYSGATDGRSSMTWTLEAGTYSIATPHDPDRDRGVRVYSVTVTEEEAAVIAEAEFTLNVGTDMELFGKNTKQDGEVIKAGTDEFFSVYCATNTAVESKSKTFEDGTKIDRRLNFGGATAFNSGYTAKNVVGFATERPATVKVWWAANQAERPIAIYNAEDNSVVETTDLPGEKDKLMISEFELAEAGSYYLGCPEGGNYIFQIQVTVEGTGDTKPERADWAEVSAPAVTAVAAGEKAGDIAVTVSALVGYDGGDEVVVYMYDKDGNEIDSKRSIAEKDEHILTFTPAASGEYTFKAVLSRDGETEAKESAASAPYTFSLPLGVPSISSATSEGGGKITLVWGAVKEATGYNVYCNGTLAGTADGTEFTVAGLTVGETYLLSVAAIRGDETGEKSEEISATATGDAQTVWGFTRYGPSTDDAHNGYVGNLNDGQVTVFSEGGKGKVQPGSNDGLAFYYTPIPESKNFTLRANIHVDSWTYSNGQEGFGMLVTDRLAPNGTATFWTNQYMAMASKVEYVEEGNKYSMKLGLGANAKLGMTSDNITDVETPGSSLIPQVCPGDTYPLDTTAAQQGKPAGTYNSIGNCTNTPGGANVAELTDFVMEIQRNNTGYFITYYDADGNILGQQKNYDPKALSQLDSEYVYAGFFAARNARITVSDVTLTTIDPSEDAPAEEKPVTKVEPTIAITSGSVANNEDYTLSLYANVAGLATVSLNGKVIITDEPVVGGVRLDKAVKLEPGKNKIEVVFKPDADQDLGEDTILSSTDPVTVSTGVEFTQGFMEQKNLYVSPNGKPSGNGGPEYPLDIYTAVKSVHPGQTIVVMEGTYKLNSTVRIERGIDGTEEMPIRMIVDPEAKSRPVFDFQKLCAGFVAGGNYWYFQGFDVTGSADGQKGFQLSGSNCVLDQLHTYHNGNTGVQLSRLYGSDTFEDWPANNLILNCTSYGNADSGYEDADGFAAKLTVGEGNVFDGCVAHHNADDGWDLYAKVGTGSIGAVTIQNCVAYSNGYLEDGTNAGNGNGFKMGGENLSGNHKLINSYSFFNKAKGFDSNSCPNIHVENSTAYNNESYNVAYYTNVAQNTGYTADGIISFKDSSIKSGLDKSENLKPNGQPESDIYGASNYYWDGTKSTNKDGVEITADMFVSLEFKGVLRNADGTIDLQGFLELTDAAPDNAGAVPGGQESGSFEIVPDENLPTPPTGDTAPVMLWVMLLVASAAALACGYGYRKRA